MIGQTRHGVLDHLLLNGPRLLHRALGVPSLYLDVEGLSKVDLRNLGMSVVDRPLRNWPPSACRQMSPRSSANGRSAVDNLPASGRFSSCRVQAPAGIQGRQPGDRRAALAFRKPQFVELLKVEPELPRGAEEAPQAQCRIAGYRACTGRSGANPEMPGSGNPRRTLRFSCPRNRRSQRFPCPEQPHRLHSSENIRITSSITHVASPPGFTSRRGRV